MHLTITQISTRLLRAAVLAILSWALAASGVFAQVIVQYAGTTTASTTTATNTTNTAITSSAGSITNLCTAPNILRVSGGSFNQTTPTNYLQFTVKPAAGYQFSVTNISIDAKRTTAGPPNGRIDYSANGGAFSTGTNFTVGTVASSCTAPPTFSRSVSGVNITDATNGLVVRVYFWATTTATGNLDFANVTVNGTVSILPAAPTLTSPTAVSITQNSATLGATITIDGGASITERGTVYKTTAGVTATDNPLAEGGTTTGAFSHTRTGLSPQTQYFYKGYAVNTNGTGLSSEGSFRTLSNPPTGAASNLTATLATTTSANLSWTGGTFPASGATKYGYLVLRSAATPGLVASPNGLAPASALSSGTVLVSNIETTAPTAPGTTASATGLSVATTHTFTVIPYTWDGTNTSTYHYLTSGAPTASLTLNPNIYTWIGDDGGSWTDAANWSPASIPTTDDAVLFDGAYGEVINVPTVALSWLRFEGGSFVILRAATTATVSVTGGSAPQFGVENGSYVVLGGTAALTINVANGVGSIYGDLVLERGAHRLNAANANAITFHNGSSFTTGNPDNPGFSGNPFGTTGTANIVYFDQGSLYFHNEGSNPFGLTAPASRVVFHKFSDYFVQTAGSIALAASGRTYGNLWVINGTTATGSGSGDFTFTSIYVEGGSSFSFTGSSTNAIYVRGDIYNDDALTLNAGTGALNFSDSLTHEIYAYADLTMRRVVVGTGTLLNLSEGSFICNTSCVVNGELNMFYSVISGTGTFTLNAGGILHTAATDGLSATGSLALSGTKTMSSNATYYYDAFDFQYTGEHLPASVSKLFAYNALELTQSLTVTQEMEMNDIVTTGAANKLTIPTTTTFNVFGGHVNGTLEKGISAGVDKLVSFEVGDDVYFSPIDMTFDVVNTGGMISVKAEPTDHPEIGSSIFDPNFTANRYWTISGNGVTFQTYGLAAIWDYFDLDAGVLTPNLFGGIYHNSAWTYPTIDYQDYTSAGISGITTFGDLQFGECVAPTVTGVVTDESCAGSFDGAINLTVSGGTAPYAFLWDNGDETEDITDLTAGTYEVTVTATGLCETVVSFTVNATPAATYYADADGDTYGNAAVSQMSCTPISGYVTNDDDCDDTNANINPGATEICNNIDDDCDTIIDDVPGGCGGSPDADMDGYTIAQGDCDDNNPDINPGEIEICNGVDDDCDTQTDEGVQLTFYADADGDTYGDAGSTAQACTAPTGFVANDDDCDDTNANV
ncbi:MAG: MopE-related protein, partial [Saprospiraceae bacterium]